MKVDPEPLSRRLPDVAPGPCQNRVTAPIGGVPPDTVAVTGVVVPEEHWLASTTAPEPLEARTVGGTGTAVVGGAVGGTIGGEVEATTTPPRVVGVRKVVAVTAPGKPDVVVSPSEVGGDASRSPIVGAVDRRDAGSGVTWSRHRATPSSRATPAAMAPRVAAAAPLLAGQRALRADELHVAQDAVAKMQWCRHDRHAGEQGQRADHSPALVVARRAVVDVARDALAPQRRELAVPTLEQAVEPGAVGPAPLGDQVSTQGAFHLVAQARHQHVGVVGRRAQRLAQGRAFETLAQVQVEGGPVAGGEPGGSRPHQLAQLLGLDHLVGPVAGRRHLELLGGNGALLAPPMAEGFVAGDGEQPRAQTGRVTQLVELAVRGDEGVVGRVGGLVAVAQDRPAEVVQPVGVPVIDAGPRALVARASGENQVEVIDSHAL